jgi:tubulin-folding cofactor B
VAAKPETEVPFELPEDVVVGARCETAVAHGGLLARGIIRFAGEASMGKGGVWVGVELDEPVGKGDGS